MNKIRGLLFGALLGLSSIAILGFRSGWLVLPFLGKDPL